MSALGQKQTSRDVWAKSALPPKADIGTGTCITFDATIPAARRYYAAILRASSLLSALSGSVKKDSGPYRFQRTIARADFMLASLPSIISVRWKISPLTTAVLFTVTRLAWRVPLT